MPDRYWCPTCDVLETAADVPTCWCCEVPMVSERRNPCSVPFVHPMLAFLNVGAPDA